MRRLYLILPLLFLRKLFAQTTVGEAQQRSTGPGGAAAVWFRVTFSTVGNRFLVPDSTILIDQTAGTFGARPISGPTFVDGERPAGVVNGLNTTFTLAAAPVPPSSLYLYRNGVRQAVTSDYSLSGVSLTFFAGSIPQPGDILLADYRR